MSSESKPFEIRCQLLNLAKDILSENAHMIYESKKISVHSSGIKLTNVAQEWPKYTTEDILAEAEKLYAFVSKR